MKPSKNKKYVKDLTIPQTIEQLDVIRKDIVFYEDGNPFCVVNLLPDKVKAYAMRVSPRLLGMNTDELRATTQPNQMDEMLRLAFWDEFFIASDACRKMRMDAIYPKVCTREHFYRHIISNEHRLAFILRPPDEYMLKMRSLLELGLRKFEEILRLPINPQNPDTKLIATMIQVVSLIDNRVRGAVPQRLHVEGKTMNVNMNYQAPRSMESIDEEIEQLENEINSHEQGIIDVRSTSEEAAIIKA